MKDLIVLEGVDGVGKSTLVDMLCKTGFKSLHFKFDPDSSITYPAIIIQS